MCECHDFLAMSYRTLTQPSQLHRIVTLAFALPERQAVRNPIRSLEEDIVSMEETPVLLAKHV
jgi:hypothetical protein